MPWQAAHVDGRSADRRRVCVGLFVNPNPPLQKLSLQHRGIRRVLSGPRLCPASALPQTSGKNEILDSKADPGFRGVTDYASKMLTLHYGAVVAKEPRGDADEAACRLLGQRLAKWATTTSTPSVSSIRRRSRRSGCSRNSGCGKE